MLLIKNDSEEDKKLNMLENSKKCIETKITLTILRTRSRVHTFRTALDHRPITTQYYNIYYIHKHRITQMKNCSWFFNQKIKYKLQTSNIIIFTFI